MHYKRLIYEAVGEASVACCSCPEKAGVFDSQQATEAAEELYKKLISFLGGDVDEVLKTRAFVCSVEAMYKAGICWSTPQILGWWNQDKLQTYEAAHRIAQQLCDKLFCEDESKDWFQEAF